MLSVKTPTGQTERIKVRKIIIQGSVWSPSCCTSTMDKIGKKAYKTGSRQPPVHLQGHGGYPHIGHSWWWWFHQNKCIYEQLCRNEKLKYGVKKYHKMHVGPKTTICSDIRVHNESGSTVQTDKYCGDLISSNSSNVEKIKERCDRGFGIINDIISILEELPLSQFHIPAGLKCC